MPILMPSDARETADAVAWAAGGGHTLEIIAGGTKRALGRPMSTEHKLDLRGLAGVLSYEPAELVLTARPGEPMAAIEAALAASGQMLAFEPPDWRGLLGGAGEPTLGGVIACNGAGPRRVRAGAARDFILGFSAVNGFGEPWKAGGKVVKNVTGYDMAKLQTGAFGTLSALTEITLKTAPKPETAATLVLTGLADDAAIRALAEALNAPHEVTGAAHLPAAAARRSSLGSVASGGGAVTAVRLEGPLPSVAYRLGALEAEIGRGLRLDVAATETFWKEMRDVRPLTRAGERIVWRLNPTPSRSAAVVAACAGQLESAEAIYDWGGGLIWLSLEPGDAGPDGGAAVVRAAAKAAGGYATLIAAPAALRAAVPVFEPLDAPLMRLTERIKAGFDPGKILNPGRMYEGC
jgi:glycolate oxidase FAD binding subunit